ncbi:hypothetical protein HPB47_016867 [Ixodes persulcatus]|uniref:Uncharacterized protein n=1 Tax=Ixodes persulcatus TaxID=34615 RepID=A0AC60QQT4_IXOPE|nr:hypothetical protein HPB47_016867 [Ixodes persulcatus]
MTTKLDLIKKAFNDTSCATFLDIDNYLRARLAKSCLISMQIGSFLREEWFQGHIGISYFFGGQERKGCNLPHLDGKAIYIIFVQHYQF